MGTDDDARGLSMSVKTKTSAAAYVKAGDQGVVDVAFAQLEVVDHDGDYTMPGAFPVGKKVKVCQWGHAHYQRVVGAGEIIGEVEQPDGTKWAVARLEYFLNTPEGRAEFDTVKALQAAGVGCEWSYGYDVLDAEFMQADGRRVQALKALDPYEISPVLRGAGIGTHTLAVKSKAEGVCDACGQSLPESDAKTDSDDADVKETDQRDACAECEKAIDECTCDPTSEKGRAESLALQWQAMKLRRATAAHNR